jgi:hypothetical protein
MPITTSAASPDATGHPPAVEAGISDHVWELDELVALLA